MSLFAALSVSASGLAAQRTRAQLLAENLANAETTRTPAGGPYRRKDAVFAAEPVPSAFADAFQIELGGLTGVRVAEIVEDPREPEKRYLPGHPDADAEGYVAFPRVNPAEDMVDLMGAVRGYQANLAAVSAIKDMIHRSIELLR
ncbi:MAG: flagellar basal body rod protein FlgC [Bryobacterales bacterium]|nr:flagellar basal body rod protein FlgC [Bryobacteraceae bacterium]MDW8129565.1 flagellar basal body rod protein FlgC [Bryobacterales bacterium]